MNRLSINGNKQFFSPIWMALVEQTNVKAKPWETGGSQRRILDSALNILGTALAGRPAAEVAASGLSPTINAKIKEATTDENGNLNQTANLAAHALWGAIEAYSGKRNVAAGATGAVTGEVAAGVVSKILYDKSPDKLSQEEKDTVSTLSQAAAGLVGGAVADQSDGVVVATETAKRDAYSRTVNTWIYRIISIHFL